MEQLLLVTSCDSPAVIGASLQTDAQRTDGWTDRRDVGNSILDLKAFFAANFKHHELTMNCDPSILKLKIKRFSL